MNATKLLSLSIALGLFATACGGSMDQAGDDEELGTSEDALVSAFAWTAPTLNAQIPAGSTVGMSWTGGDPSWNVNIALVDVAANAAVASVATNVANTRVRSWTLPSTLTCNKTYEFYVENTQHTAWAYGKAWKLTCATSGVLAVPTPLPTNACTVAVAVNNLHYPTQTCAQTQSNFVSGLQTSYHFNSKCPTGTKLLGVLDATCQNAPIPGFSSGSIYGGIACCGVKVSALYTTSDQYNAIWTAAQVETYARNRANSECVTKHGTGSVAQDVIVSNITYNNATHETFDLRKFNCILP